MIAARGSLLAQRGVSVSICALHDLLEHLVRDELVEVLNRREHGTHLRVRYSAG